MARRSAASPLAQFLDYVVTAPLAESKAAIEASIAILRMREGTPTPRARRASTPPAAAPASVAAPTGPVAVPSPTPAAAAPRRRGRPAGSTNATKAPKTATTRRRRPAVDAVATAVVPAVVDDAAQQPSANPLPEQIPSYEET